ncbi:MAG: hypothetical protein M0T74_09610 [Desulfitobacterium hafniense]|nr:hypothetical protein [Desulfitobacterium hafniense]
MHILRAFIIITIGSYWFVNANGFLSTLTDMLGTGIKFTIIYAVVRYLSDAFTVNNQEIEKPWFIKH